MGKTTIILTITRWLGRNRAVKDSDLLEMTSLKKLPSETRTEALLVKYVAYFGICQ